MQNELISEKLRGCEVLRNIPLKLDLDKVMRRAAFQTEGLFPEKEALQLVKKGATVARPIAIFKASPVQNLSANVINIDGIRFDNALLRVNLKDVDRAFPYLVSCGHEIDSMKLSGKQAGLNYVVDAVKEMVLAEAANYLRNHITDKYNLDYLWSLQPGEPQAWKIEDRRLLFEMLGQVEELTGVKLSSDNSLIPKQSTCGIFYYAKVEFEGCQVCAQEPCMGRRAPYSEELAKKFSDRARKPCGMATKKATVQP
jgi:hypothetical protein